MSEQVVVITGASSGIGAALAVELSARHDRVVLVARRADALAAVAERCQERAHPVVADMTVRADVQRVVNTSIAAFGRIDAWVNNVGQGITRVPSELTDEDIDEVMRVNVKSALYGMQEVLPHFKERGAGHVVNVSSMLGRIPFAMPRSAYCGAKHFLNALTATIREEVQATHPGIQFSLVSPGVGTDRLRPQCTARRAGFAFVSRLAKRRGSRAGDRSGAGIARAGCLHPSGCEGAGGRLLRVGRKRSGHRLIRQSSEPDVRRGAPHATRMRMGVQMAESPGALFPAAVSVVMRVGGSYLPVRGTMR